LKEENWANAITMLCNPFINFWMTEPIFIKRGKYVMSPEPISTAHFINPTHQPIRMCNPYSW
jgi:hypothetical protein